MRRSYAASLVAVVVVAVIALGATVASGNSPRLGLDLQGGESVVLQPKGPTTGGTLDKAIEIIRRRVDALGVAEPEITRQGRAIIIQLPGVKDPQRALDVVGQTAKLYFRPVIQALPPSPNDSAPPRAGTTTNSTTATAPGSSPRSGVPGTSTPATPASPGETSTIAPGPAAPSSQPASLGVEGGGRIAVQLAAATAPGDPTPSSPAPAGSAPAAPPAPGAPASATGPPPPSPVASLPPSRVPPGSDIPTTPPSQDDPTKQVVLPQLDKAKKHVTQRYLLAPAIVQGKIIDGTIISGANPSVDPTTGAWRVDFTVRDSASRLFDALAAANVGKQVAIELDGVVISAPVFQTASFNGRGQITGDFTHRDAKDLALVLRYGSLPVQLEPQTVQTVSATLGKDSLSAGLIAGAVGLALVALYMLLYYRALGLVVVAGLGVSGALMYSIITFLGQTRGLALSLSGATGIIVSVGVTVDSYVVYFERLKDEIRSGRTIRSSVDRGFTRAYRTILAADLVSLIGAVLLYFLSVGAVRGFAFFLGLSTLLDLVTAYVFTRPAVILLGRNRLFTEARWLGVARGLALEPAGSTS
ncbi:MAG: protein translocase subunit SecD [Acidimicrobiales bacterium]